MIGDVPSRSGQSGASPCCDGQQLRRLRRRKRQHDRVTGGAEAVTGVDPQARPARVRPAGDDHLRDRLRRAAQAHAHPGPLERGATAGVVDLAQRDDGPTDVAGGRVVQQPNLEDLRRLRQRGVVNRQVHRRAHDQLPDRLDRCGGSGGGGAASRRTTARHWRDRRHPRIGAAASPRPSAMRSRIPRYG